MNNYLSECIEGATNFIKYKLNLIYRLDKNTHFYEYQSPYFFANENIKGYLELFEFKANSRALSVLSSGDHVFNLISKGIKNIDTFDINKLTEFYALGIKRAMVYKYSYNDFLECAFKLYDQNTSNEEIFEIIYGLLDYMDESHKVFWKSIIDIYIKLDNKEGINFINTILLKETAFYPIKCNIYLESEEKYNEFKSKLINANIHFKSANALNLASTFKDYRYDAILLSNILDYFGDYWGRYWTYEKLQTYIQNIETIASNDAYIFLKYVMSYQGNNPRLFMLSKVRESDLTKEDVITFPRPSFNKEKCAAMVLKRVKK